jgi:hypothetical protein
MATRPQSTDLAHDADSPVGARVRYHGSQRDKHGEYTVLGYCWDWFGIGWKDGRPAAWHDGCTLCSDDDHDRYVLAKTSATRIIGLLEHVRRTSFTMIGART